MQTVLDRSITRVSNFFHHALCIMLIEHYHSHLGITNRLNTFYIFSGGSKNNKLHLEDDMASEAVCKTFADLPVRDLLNDDQNGLGVKTHVTLGKWATFQGRVS